MYRRSYLPYKEVSSSRHWPLEVGGADCGHDDRIESLRALSKERRRPLCSSFRHFRKTSRQKQRDGTFYYFLCFFYSSAERKM